MYNFANLYKAIIVYATFICASGLYALPAQVLIIKHAEKSADSTSLSLKGKQRAAALVPYLQGTKELITHGVPVAIYAAGMSKDNTSPVSIDTVQPLATALGLSIKDIFTKADYKELVNEILNDFAYNGKTVLISWDPQTIPELARAFKAFQTPGRWQGEAADRIWIITFATKDRVTFQNLPQKLMFGDSPN